MYGPSPRLGFLTTKRKRKALSSRSIWPERGKQTNTANSLGVSHKRERTEAWSWLCAHTSFSIATLEGAVLLSIFPLPSCLPFLPSSLFFLSPLRHLWSFPPGSLRRTYLPSSAWSMYIILCKSPAASTRKWAHLIWYPSKFYLCPLLEPMAELGLCYNYLCDCFIFSARVQTPSAQWPWLIFVCAHHKGQRMLSEHTQSCWVQLYKGAELRGIRQLPAKPLVIGWIFQSKGIMKFVTRRIKMEGGGLVCMSTLSPSVRIWVPISSIHAF